MQNFFDAIIDDIGTTDDLHPDDALELANAGIDVLTFDDLQPFAGLIENISCKRLHDSFVANHQRAARLLRLGVALGFIDDLDRDHDNFVVTEAGQAFADDIRATLG